MRRAGRWRGIAVLALACSLAMTLPSLGASRPVALCAGFRVVASIGPTCPNPDGSFRVYSSAGAFLGVTHGNDPLAPAATGSSASPPPAVPPVCAPNAYAFVVIYARAADGADNYAARVADLRSLMAGVNGYVRQASNATGDQADLQVLCASGAIVVRHEILPTRRAAASFSTIVADLRNKGYNDTTKKYAVYYDDASACKNCSGQGMFVDDERAGADNPNNGNASYPLFAVDYGHLNAHVMLHEMSHTLGAVGTHAPHTTGAHHCTDGLDVMCYNDGGPNGARYTTSACSTDQYDCRKDDYFNARPPAGSYLATHWNLASRANRYFSFPRAVIQSLVCPAKAGVRRLTYCTFSAIDRSSAIWYALDWGDGVRARVPSSGSVAPGTSQYGTHSYTKVGKFKVTLVAYNARAASLPLAFVITAIADTTPPVLTLSDPQPGTLYIGGCANKVPTVATGPVFVQKGCVVARATDAGSGVARVTVYMGRSHMGTLYKAPYVFQFPVGLPGTNIPIRIEAWDVAGNVATKTVVVDIG